MNNKYLIWGIVVVVVVIIIGAIVWRGGLPGVTSTPGATSTNTGTNTGGTTPSVGTATPPAQVVIRITAPVVNDVWKIGTAHSITWTEAPNFTGYIYLIDAGTKNLVGVILPQVGPQQTSYSWDTRHLALSRSDPSQKDVVPGTYFVTMAFDGNNLPVISSPVFAIVN